MKSAFALSLVVFLLAPSVSVSAQGPTKWSRVRDIEPGTEITVTVTNSPPGQRYFIAADESSLAVLNIPDSMSDRVRQVLIDTASDNPDCFALAHQNRTFVLHKDMHLTLTPDGVFLGAEKVADREQIVMQIVRGDVGEISVLARPVGRGTWLGAVIGATAGFVIGLLSPDDFFSPAEVGLLAASLGGGIGSGVGAGVGALHKTRTVIYRAP